MTVLRPRSRSISVRLSEEEFAALQAVCVATGARSISDLARKAMQEVLERVDEEITSNLNHDGRSSQIKSLERKVEELAAELATFKVRQAVRRPGV
jgi:GH24 family phage-related lysozyme (muramidase)